MRIGVDIDGVLADFNASYITRVIDAADGVDLFPPRPFDIPTWHYPQFYGYSEDLIKTVWTGIKASEHFWETLPPYDYTEAVLFDMLKCWYRGDYVYFITDRPGVNAKAQTERWLEKFAFGGKAIPNPTVLISAKKGLCAASLGLHVYIDDKLENCESVVKDSPETLTLLFDQPWNRSTEIAGAKRVTSAVGFAELAKVAA